MNINLKISNLAIPHCHNHCKKSSEVTHSQIFLIRLDATRISFTSPVPQWRAPPYQGGRDSLPFSCSMHRLLLLFFNRSFAVFWLQILFGYRRGSTQPLFFRLSSALREYTGCSNNFFWWCMLFLADWMVWWRSIEWVVWLLKIKGEIEFWSIGVESGKRYGQVVVVVVFANLILFRYLDSYGIFNIHFVSFTKWISFESQANLSFIAFEWNR